MVRRCAHQQKLVAVYQACSLISCNNSKILEYMYYTLTISVSVSSVASSLDVVNCVLSEACAST